MAKFYVYRFKDIDGRVVYVGKTKNINNRMHTHFGSRGHLTKEQYDTVAVVEYITLKNKIEMDIKELYYISKLKPIFNTIHNGYEEVEIDLGDHEVWEVYFDNTEESIVNTLKSKLTRLEKENDTLRRLLQEISPSESPIKLSTRKKRSDSRKTLKCTMNKREYLLFKRLQQEVRAVGKNGTLTDLALATECVYSVYGETYDASIIEYVNTRKYEEYKQLNARINLSDYDEVVLFNSNRIDNDINLHKFLLASILQYAKKTGLYFEVEDLVQGFC